MAETESGEEKTEEATGKRLDEARSKGNVPRSRELTIMAMTVASAVGLWIFGARLIGMFVEIMREGFSLRRDQLFDDKQMLIAFEKAVWDAVQEMSLLFVLLAVVAVLSNIALSGWVFSAEKLQPQFGKLNPLKGLKRLFGVHGLAELGKSLVKFALISAVAGSWLWSKTGEVLGLGLEPVDEALIHTAHLFIWTFILVGASLGILVLFDVPFQLWNYRRQMKMTKQEVKEEFKQAEGNPEVKGRIRRLQMEAAIKRMMQSIPKADVVVTNPTHFAVALQYDQATMRAPRVVAKGADLVAARIREEAELHRVPILRAPPLARAIYYSTELDQEIPAGLYLAVAQVLAYVYQVKTAAGGPPPPPPADLPVPEEFLQGKAKGAENPPGPS